MANLYDNDGGSQKISLRTFLYQKVKLSPKESLFAEIHCERPEHSVEIVYANTPEGEAEVEMINKQVAGYLWNALKEASASEDFVRRLLINTIDMTLLHEAPKCDYDFETVSLTTPGEAVEKQVRKSMKKTSFYQDFVGQALSLGKDGKSKKKYTDPALKFDLDAERSVKTVHGKNDGKYANKGTAAAVDLTVDNKNKAPDASDNVLANSLDSFKPSSSEDGSNSKSSSSNSSNYSDDSSQENEPRGSG